MVIVHKIAPAMALCVPSFSASAHIDKVMATAEGRSQSMNGKFSFMPPQHPSEYAQQREGPCSPQETAPECFSGTVIWFDVT